MKLEDMSLEKLWDLFPITLVDNKDDFKEIYLEEEKKLKSLLGNYIIRISHIGSTSIQSIKTKPIIDILIEIKFDNKEIIKEVLLKNGYILMSESFAKLSFNKGYTCRLYTSPSPRDRQKARKKSSA